MFITNVRGVIVYFLSTNKMTSENFKVEIDLKL